MASAHIRAGDADFNPWPTANVQVRRYGVLRRIVVQAVERDRDLQAVVALQLAPDTFDAAL